MAQRRPSSDQAWKAEQGLVDYVDMIDTPDRARRPCGQARTADRLRFVVVDELQDSSPSTRALSEAAPCRTRRGSEIEAMHLRYAGADPALMDAVLEWADKSDGRVGISRRTGARCPGSSS
jgi:hypothetical protein